MRKKMMFFMAMLLLVARSGAATFDHDVKAAEEFRGRDGLPNFFAKLQQGQMVRVAYLGGSITAANGWRPRTLAWFKAQWPTAKVEEINAAISGTGSDYGACRLQDDVLAQNPDLVFLDCRVNGGDRFEAESVEGIVRHIWQQNPRTDICFVYTISSWLFEELQAGRNTSFGAVMETVANAYGIPTIDLGVEVARREKEGSLVFIGTDPAGGKLVFASDSAHPTDAGHDIYRDVVVRSMLKMKDLAQAKDHVLPSPLKANNWQTAGLLPVDKCTLSSGWVPVDAATDTVYTDDKWRTDAMLRGAVKCNQAGQTITVKWNGTTIGMSDIPYGEGSVIEAVVDGGKPIVIKRVYPEAIHKYARFYYLPEQPPGVHTVTFTVKQVPQGGWVYAGHALVVGTVVP